MLDNLFATLKLGTNPEENANNRRKVIRSFKAKADARRTPTEKFADWLTIKFGTIAFLSLNAIWFSGWILINTNSIPGIKPFDPYPFNFLTMVVSLEAIFLAIIVLVSQNREAKIGELREEIELQLSTISESEVTKLIKLTVLLLEKQGISIEDDPELKRMIRPTSNAQIEKDLERELNIKPNSDK
jgi:uncharacterized membrane protein